jgi:BRCA1-associated protein
MPSYLYHIKLEVYPTPDPTATASQSPTSGKPWLPPKNTSIFDNLPSHPRKESKRFPVRPQPFPIQEPAKLKDRARDVIDCGASRAPSSKESAGNIERISERQWRSRTKSFPPPSSFAAIRPQTAVRDWRFSKLYIESVDLEAGATDIMTTDSEDSGGQGSSSAALGVGPTFGGAGAATKAQFMPLDTKHTDIGWGIVHFYREGEEIPSADPEAAEEGAEEDLKGEDCTTLCIPAVPSYLTPADFLGFVGEKWRDDVMHYRMVMTSRLNRYLVLMKFRDGKRARQWRKDFDGKVFNSMEVCFHVTKMQLYISAILTCSGYS